MIRGLEGGGGLMTDGDDARSDGGGAMTGGMMV